MSPTAVDIQYIVAAIQGAPAAAQSALTRAPRAYVGALFDLDARRAQNRDGAGGAAAALSELEHAAAAAVGAEIARRSAPSAAGAANATAAAAAAAGSAGSTSSTFHEVHGLVFENVPRTLRKLVVDAMGLSEAADDGWLDVLDAGSGRGAAGIVFRGLANRLVGVDLSPLAVSAAQKLGVYDGLSVGCMHEALADAPPASVDLVVAADSVPYMGDLSDLAAAAAAALRPRGCLVFNYEFNYDQGGGGSPADPYVLRFTGRWGHSPGHVSEVLAAAGLEIVGSAALSARSHFSRHSSSQIYAHDEPAAVSGRAVLACRER